MLTNSVSVCDLYLGVSGLTRVAPGPVVAPQMTLGFGLNDPAVKGRLEGLKNFGVLLRHSFTALLGEHNVNNRVSADILHKPVFRNSVKFFGSLVLLNLRTIESDRLVALL